MKTTSWTWMPIYVFFFWGENMEFQSRPNHDNHCNWSKIRRLYWRDYHGTSRNPSPFSDRTTILSARDKTSTSWPFATLSIQTSPPPPKSRIRADLGKAGSRRDSEFAPATTARREQIAAPVRRNPGATPNLESRRRTIWTFSFTSRVRFRLRFGSRVGG